MATDNKTAAPAAKTAAAIEAAGKAACRRHGLDKVYMTSDGTAFRTRQDARNHAAKIGNVTVTTVSK